ncbi:MAG: DUF484 family protein [Desulfobacteraceae bacterium]|nr:DUF484 family protein [Desulfobacteraceae bacterium]
MNDMNDLIERMRDNEEIARKFFEIESNILKILNFKDFFEVLLTEIQRTFKIPYVWITLIEKSELSGIIDTLETSEFLRERINIIDQDLFREFVGSGARPRLVNEKLKPYFRLFPPRRKFLIKSIAIIPISLDGEPIGSLNQADTAATRFQPGIDTSLLEKLALKVSLCLSNVTAHEKLRLLTKRGTLTGLLTPPLFEDMVKRELFRSKRNGRAFSLIALDFQQDARVLGEKKLGKGILIAHISETLRKLCRGCDLLAIYENNTYIALLPETHLQEAAHFINRLSSYFANHPFEHDGSSIRLTFIHMMISNADSRATTFSDIHCWINSAARKYDN